MRMVRSLMLSVGLAAAAAMPAVAQKQAWRAATAEELSALLPARAPVEKEHIETEMRTASGITNGHGRFIAGVILITAGYSADGKYSHYLVVQAPMKVGGLTLAAGEYVFGWERDKSGEGIVIHFHDASTGKLLGEVDAKKIQGPVRVESLRIWPPGEKAQIQVGRFAVPYELED